MMLGYALRRIAGTVPTLLILVTLSFFVIRLAPGGPFATERALTPQVRANLDHLYGLDRPLGVQYLHYLDGIVHGDLGLSYKLRDQSVAGLIAQGLPVSVTVGFAALALAVLCGVPLGICAALRRGGAVDYAVTGLATLAIALPTFVTGPLLALVFGLALQWLPVAGWEQGAPIYLILPAVGGRGRRGGVARAARPGGGGGGAGGGRRQWFSRFQHCAEYSFSVVYL